MPTIKINRENIEETKDNKLTKIKKKFNIESTNFYDIQLISQKKNYQIFFKNYGKATRFRLKTPLMKIPFGIEKYNFKEIVNLEFINTKNNDVQNFLSSIKEIDSFFFKLKYQNFYNDLDCKINENNFLDKYYISCLRFKDNFNPLLRVHLKKNKNAIKSIFYKKDSSEEINPYNIKGSIGTFTIEIGNIWFSNTDFGLIWYINGGYIN